MATEAQILANQANARLSTGPGTAEASACSAQNSLRHGFRPQSVFLPGDDPAEYRALLDELETHFEPADFTEQRAVREMAAAEWRLRRVRSHLASLVCNHIAELESSHPDAGAQRLQFLAFKALHQQPSLYAVFARYEAGFERRYQRAYAAWLSYQEKKSLQRCRHSKAAIGEILAAPLPGTPGPNEANGEPPSPANQPNEANSEPAPVQTLTNEANPTPRNAPCPCGSGEKYKRCHGRTAPPVLSPSPAWRSSTTARPCADRLPRPAPASSV